MTNTVNTTPAVFQFNGTTVQTVIDDQGEPWFAANEVCGILGYANPRDTIAKHCHTKGVAKRDTLTEGGKQEMTFINEGNLYRLMVKSRKPEAERFESWVMEEVLPTLRKTGRYEVPVETAITPAQQRQLQNAIAARFPEGKQRPYAWGRFNNHFSLGSYKQLATSRVDEALVYISQMPGGADETERERLARDLLGLARFIMSVDDKGMLRLKEIPHDAFVFNAEELPALVGSTDYPVTKLPHLIRAAAERLSA